VDFSEYPLSVTEIRSGRTNEANDWTPRDALIDTLRRIDKGEIAPEALVVVMKHRRGEKDVSTELVTAAPNDDTKIAILARAFAVVSA
jgi:hypothetical protein